VLAEAAGEEARLVLRWARPVSTRSSVAGRELLLRFDAELQAPDLERAARALSGWVEGLQQGYDTLLVVAARDVVFEVGGTGETVEILLRPMVTATAGADAATPDERRRLALVGARLKAQLGEARAARETVRRVMSEGGRTVDAVAQLAEVERQLGNWQHALELYDEALVLVPDDQGLIVAKASLLRERGARYEAVAQRQIVSGGDNQWIARTEGRVPVLERGEIVTITELRDVTVDDLTRPNGDQGRFEGERARGEIAYVQNFDDEAMSIRPSLLTSSETVGGGLLVERRDGFGATRLGVDYRGPYWDLLEGIADGGTRDRIELSREQRLDPEGRWAMRTAINHNRYGLDGESDLAQSIGGQGELSYAFSETRPFATIGYQLDAEYVLGRHDKTGADGFPFAPLPIISREVHTVLVSAGDRVADNLVWSAFAGYSYDRKNFESITVTPSKLTFTGLQWGGELIYEPAADFEFGVRYASSDTSNRGTANSLTQLSLFATGRF
ncbi:MAG: hypothetical protein HOK81_15405, partial [Rhodospirillaceae bacterium]|nr:hypothetical protein [Rhodospirillaceae bacterium]